jgi:hypothetical protein
MKHLLTVLALTYATAGFSQTILRTATIQPTRSSERYTVEVSIIELQPNMSYKITNELQEVVNESYTADPVYVCESTLKITSGVKMKYALLDSSGKVLGSKIISPDLGLRKTISADDKTICKSQFVLNSLVSVIHPDQFVNFEILENGKKANLAVSSNFLGFAKLANKSSNLKVNPATVNQVRWFFNNETGGASDLIDPANPPAKEENSYCLAHPYDCN